MIEKNDMESIGRHLMEQAKENLSKDGELQPVLFVKRGEQTTVIGMEMPKGDKQKSTLFRMLREAVRGADMTAFVTDAYMAKPDPAKVPESEIMSHSVSELCVKYGVKKQEAIVINVETPILKLTMAQEYDREQRDGKEQIVYGAITECWPDKLEGRAIMFPETTPERVQ